MIQHGEPAVRSGAPRFGRYSHWVGGVPEHVDAVGGSGPNQPEQQQQPEREGGRLHGDHRSAHLPETGTQAQVRDDTRSDLKLAHKR